MKLRILGNSLRFRLSQSDLKNLTTLGTLKEEVSFPGNSNFKYSLTSNSELINIKAIYAKGQISILVPSNQVNDLHLTGRIGIYEEVSINDNDVLKLSIEKDFKCLTPRNENETDLFPNPKESH